MYDYLRRPLSLLFSIAKLVLFALSFVLLVGCLENLYSAGDGFSSPWVDFLGLSVSLCLCMATFKGVFWNISNIVHGTPIASLFPVETNHGSRPEEVVAAICDERVAFLALFSEKGERLTEMTHYSYRDVPIGEELMDFYEENSRCYEIRNRSGFLGKDYPFSPRNVASAMDYGVGASCLVTQDTVYELRFNQLCYTSQEIRQARKLMRRTLGLFPSYERRILACERVAEEFDMTFKYEARARRCAQAQAASAPGTES